ncbi:MAG: biotin/lipoate--protein ligase family protein [Pseudomonadota bacterium]
MSGQIEPFEKARIEAARGCDAGLFVHNLGGNTMSVAIVFAPEEPQALALPILPICGLGFQNALGALAPPEVALHLEWGGGIHVNGGLRDRLRVAASTNDPDTVPD